MYRPGDLRDFLGGLGIKPKKGLSQNFLIDGNIIRKIINLARVEPGDIVLEIGPGPGALTQALLEAGAKVFAVEKDNTYARELSRFNTVDNRLHVFCEDIMDFSISENLPKGKKIKVIANLPYHLTTPIITELVPENHLFSTLVLMVQKEVALRMVSSPGSKTFSSLTVFLNYYSTPSYGFTVGRNCFFPRPNVDSAVVVLDLKKPPKVSNEDIFFLLTRTAFSHRRKMLRSSLNQLYPSEKISRALEEMKKNPLARPEDLSLDDFIVLFEKLQRED
jgi:16S rRNA (adenine1518-N6/adenine1519-N6)-dimethyltransferase